MSRFLPLLAVGAFALIAGCDSVGLDRPDERVTSAVLTLRPDGGGDAVRITATDADGDGRGFFFSPAFVRLRAGTAYAGTLDLFDGDADLTAEIRDEAETHLVRVAIDPASAGDAEPTDRESDYTEEDTNGADLPLGLRFRARIADGAGGAGAVDVTLYHFDAGAKTSADGLSDAVDLRTAFPVVFAPPAAGPMRLGA